jgi:hypothetical protein
MDIGTSMTVKQAAKAAGVSAMTILKRLWARQITGAEYKAGRWFIPADFVFKRGKAGAPKKMGSMPASAAETAPTP